MKLTFLGAAHEVTGSCTLLEVCNKKILIDCGMEQGPDTYENSVLPISPIDIDYVLLTHAHIDHSGKLPVLIANGYNGKIFATSATVRLCNIMLLDSAYIQESEARWRNKKAKRAGKEEYVPLYTIKDAQDTLHHFESCEYGNNYNLTDSISVRFIDAGHLMGSASIEITVNENGNKKILLFSGDIGNIDRPLIRNPQKPENADFVVIESTYGNRIHGERKDYVAQLTEIIQKTFDRGGNVVIPSFAVGRTQELLYLIRIIKEKNLIKNHDNFPVWVDSPLAVEATNIYDDKEDMMSYYDDKTLEYIKNGIEVLKFSGLKISVTSQDSRLINDDTTPKVIISASGMCEAGRIRHHLKHNLWRKESTILFVGYQAEGSLGRHLINGATSVKLFGEDINVNAQIEKMDGISGHADENMLLDWLKNLKNTPQQVFVNHGNDAVCDEFANEITQSLNFPATAPYNGAVYDLDSGKCLDKGNTVKITKKSKTIRAITPAFEKLLTAGQNLVAIINKCSGMSNKDLSKFTSQINDLCNRWK